MITKSKIIKDINNIRDNTSVKFKNFGGFVLRLMMLSVEDQEFVVDSLTKASRRATPLASIVIYSIRKLEVKSKEKHLCFILEYEFRCKWCKKICIEEINLYHCKFVRVCESCKDESQDYMADHDCPWKDEYYD